MRNSEQIDYWNGKAGDKWVLNAERLDALLAPFADEVLKTVALNAGERVLDVGCGAGALTLQAALQVGDKGSAVGIDVSDPLLKLARQRASERNVAASFERADAAQFQHQPVADAIISRFGVMFFDDPIGAFSSLKNNLKPEGRMTFACWQSLAVNDWARAPLDAALPLLSAPPEPPPAGAPGPFAFADKDRVAKILSAADWQRIEIHPWQGRIMLPGQNVDEAASFMVELGPVARLVADAGADLLKVHHTLSTMLAPNAMADGRVSMPAAAWIVSARAA